MIYIAIALVILAFIFFHEGKRSVLLVIVGAAIMLAVEEFEISVFWGLGLYACFIFIMTKFWRSKD